MKKKDNNKTESDAPQVLSLFSNFENQENQGRSESNERVLQPVARVATTAPDWTDGRDELNLAEFPLTHLDDRVPPELLNQPLVFSDTIYDSGDGGKPVVRTLTITPAAGVGLPTATDADVLLALIQLTRWSNGFTNPTVQFSRYELIQLLRWPRSARYYARLETALNRWVGVTLYYDKAWWDKRQRCWVSEKFHVLNRVSLRDRADGKSEATWGEVPFGSFRSENLKKLDIQLYFDLGLPTARRLYRFLDKRFHLRPVVSFDLRNLACEHVGLSRAYQDCHIKRKLLPAIQELENAEYIEPAEPDERFASPHTGTWRVFFRKKDPATKADGLAAVLHERGVSAPIAAALIAQFPVDHIQSRVGVLDWLTENKDKRVRQNPAGYLVESIRKSYSPPADYQLPGANPPAASVAPARQGAPATPAEENAAELARQARLAPIEAYLAALTAAERATLDDAAVAASDSARQTIATCTSILMKGAAVRRAVNAHVAKILGIVAP